MNLYAVWITYGMFVVRAEDEDHARRVAFSGPIADTDDDEAPTPAEHYGAEFDPEAIVVRLDVDGPAGLLVNHFA